MSMSIPSRGVVSRMAATPWPYRSVSAPITTSLAVYAAAGVIHYMHLEWTWVATVGVFMTVVAGMLAIMAALGRPAATYAVLTTAAATVWMSYAAATTPYSVTAAGSLLAGAILIGPFFGILRYAHNIADSQNDDVTETKTSDPWIKIFARAGYPVRVLERDDEPEYGYRLHAQLSDKTIADPLKGGLAGKLEQAAAAILVGEDRLKRGAITVEGGEYANDIIVHVNTLDVFAEDLLPPDNTHPKSITDPIELGRYIDGIAMEITFTRDYHIQSVGATGSGKSVFLNNLIRGITQCVDGIAMVSAADKGLPIVGPWLEPYASGKTNHPMLDWAAIDLAESARMLLALYKLVHLRSSKPRGIKSKLEISPRNPAVVAIFEEAPGLLRDPKKYVTHNGRSMTASEILNEITRLGRSEAVFVVVLAQYGTGEMLGADGPKMKANFGARAGFRTSSARENQYVFPDDNVALHQLVNPGEVFLKTRATPHPKFGRTYALEDDQIPVFAAAHSPYKPQIEADLAAKLGPDYTERWSDSRAGALMDAIRFNAPIEVGSATVADQPATSGDLPTMPKKYQPKLEKNSALPPLPNPYQPKQQTPEPDPADLERMFTAVEDILRSNPVPVRLTDAQKRSRLIELLTAAGPDGIRTSKLQMKLQDEGAYPARGTFFRWLGEVATQIRHGVWAII